MSRKPAPRWYTLEEMCERLGLDPDVIRARADEQLAAQAGECSENSLPHDPFRDR